MATDDSGTGTAGRPVRVRPGWATPGPARSQVLVRQTRAGRGPFRPARYEVAYYPEGLTTSPAWVRTTTSPTTVPGTAHPTDLHDLRVLVEQAWAEGDDRWTAWPVWYPAVARERDLRPLGGPERRALDDYRARQRVDREAAGEVPVRVRHPRRGDWVVDGLVHELTAPERTRCGLAAAGLTRLRTAFHPGDPQACPACSSPAPRT